MVLLFEFVCGEVIPDLVCMFLGKFLCGVCGGGGGFGLAAFLLPWFQHLCLM